MTPDFEQPEEEISNVVYAFSTGAIQPGDEPCSFLAGLSSGLLRSTDGGHTWVDALAALELSEPLPVTCIVAAPCDEREPAQHIFSGAPGGIFRSVDGGETWRGIVFPSPSPTVAALVVSPNYFEDRTVFAGTVEDGVFISRDGGDSWASWNFGLLDLNVISLALSPHYSSDETLFVGAETGVFTSTNGGRAWKEVEMPFGYSPVLSIVCQPTAGENFAMIAATEEYGIWISSDGGKCWAQLAALDEPASGLLVQPDQILAITGSGIYRSIDQGNSWNSVYVAADANREITAAFVLPPTGPASKALVGFTDGSIEIAQLSIEKG